MSNPPGPKKVGGEMDRFTDVFHSQKDNADENDDADVDFDCFFTNFDRNEEAPEPTEVPWINAVIHPQQQEEEEEEEQPEAEHLSQKLSQLTTSSKIESSSSSSSQIATGHKRPALTPTTPTAAATKAATTTAAAKKKFKPEEFSSGVAPTTTATDVEEMPDYLSPTHSTFEQLIAPLVSDEATVSKAVLVEELRQMAFCEHQLRRAELDISLWKVYLQSGTGELQEADNRSILQQLQHPQPAAPCIWSKKLKSAIMTDSSVHARDKAALTHTTYLNYVNRTLAYYHAEVRSYEAQIERTRRRLNENITPEIEQTIANLVTEEGIALYSIVIEGFIAAVQFTYKDRQVELKFEREDSYREHIQAFQTATKSQIAYETAKMEVDLLKQRVVHQQLSPIFDSFQVPTPPTLDTIQDPSMRQRLLYRYEQLVERTKSDMMALHIRAAEIKMEEAHRQAQNDVKLCFQPEPTTGPRPTTRFTHALATLMEQRFKLIEQRLTTLLELKVRFFVKAPTVNKH